MANLVLQNDSEVGKDIGFYKKGIRKDLVNEAMAFVQSFFNEFQRSLLK